MQETENIIIKRCKVIVCSCETLKPDGEVDVNGSDHVLNLFKKGLLLYYQISLKHSNLEIFQFKSERTILSFLDRNGELPEGIVCVVHSTNNV